MRRKLGFTLMEVNLAVFIMAVGVLAMVGLYPLGFRESQQSEDDVASAILADAVLNPLVQALSSPYMSWSDWNNVCSGQGMSVPVGGWGAFCDEKYRRTGKNLDGDDVIKAVKAAYDKAKGNSAGSSTASGHTFAENGDFPSLPVSGSSDANGLHYVLVATQTGIGTIQLSFRATRRKNQIFSQPLYFTEVHFQGSRYRRSTSGQ